MIYIFSLYKLLLHECALGRVGDAEELGGLRSNRLAAGQESVDVFEEKDWSLTKVLGGNHRVSSIVDRDLEPVLVAAQFLPEKDSGG